MQTIYHTSLVLHIIGLTMLAGITLADFILFKQFWKHLENNKQQGLAINAAMARLPAFFGIGVLLLIFSGVGMMAITHGVFGEQIWFRIKIALVVIIIINGLTVGRRQGAKLRKILPDIASEKGIDSRLLKIKARLRRFHISQLTLFIIIFILSVFKFN